MKFLRYFIIGINFICLCFSSNLVADNEGSQVFFIPLRMESAMAQQCPNKKHALFQKYKIFHCEQMKETQAEVKISSYFLLLQNLYN